VLTRDPRNRSSLSPRGDRGLGLVEMIVAVSVTMIVLISAGAAFVKMAQGQRSAEAADRGTQMIQDKLETIRKLPYNLVGCYKDDMDVVNPAKSTCPEFGAAHAGGERFQRRAHGPSWRRAPGHQQEQPCPGGRRRRG